RICTVRSSQRPLCGPSCRVNASSFPSGDQLIGEDDGLGGIIFGRLHEPEVSGRAFPPFAATSQMCDTSTLTLGPGFEDQVKWRLSRAPETSKPTTCHYVPQALLTCLSAQSKTDLLR